MFSREENPPEKTERRRKRRWDTDSTAPSTAASSSAPSTTPAVAASTIPTVDPALLQKARQAQLVASQIQEKLKGMNLMALPGFAQFSGLTSTPTVPAVPAVPSSYVAEAVKAAQLAALGLVIYLSFAFFILIVCFVSIFFLRRRRRALVSLLPFVHICRRIFFFGFPPFSSFSLLLCLFLAFCPQRFPLPILFLQLNRRFLVVLHTNAFSLLSRR